MFHTLSVFTADFSLRPTKTAYHRPAARKGTTIIEVMLAVAVIIVASLGTLCYEYLCVNHVSFARTQLAATRIGQLLLEDWKSTAGSDDYNPEYLGMGFNLTSALPSGHCETTLDNSRFYIRFFNSDVDTDEFAGVTLRQINVIVRWKKNFGRGPVTDDDPGVYLTTYVRQDQ